MLLATNSVVEGRDGGRERAVICRRELDAL